MVLRNAALSALVGKQTRLHRVVLLYGVAHLHVLDPEAKQGALRPVAHLRSTERREDYLHRREILHGERETLLQHEVVGISSYALTENANHKPSIARNLLLATSRGLSTVCWDTSTESVVRSADHLGRRWAGTVVLVTHILIRGAINDE